MQARQGVAIQKMFGSGIAKRIPRGVVAVGKRMFSMWATTPALRATPPVPGGEPEYQTSSSPGTPDPPWMEALRSARKSFSSVRFLSRPLPALAAQRLQLSECTDRLYITAMASKLIPFSRARQNLTAIVDEVEKLGRAVTIVRNGKPAAVLVDPETYREFVEKSARKWTLKGTMTVKSGVDLDKAIEKARNERIRMWKRRSGKLTRLIRES